jgi:hypothetical protein
MAFRERNPNFLAPTESDDATWHTVASHKNNKSSARPAPSKENYFGASNNPAAFQVQHQRTSSVTLPPQHPGSHGHGNHYESCSSSHWSRQAGLSPIAPPMSFNPRSSFSQAPQEQRNIGPSFQRSAIGTWNDSLFGASANAQTTSNSVANHGRDMDHTAGPAANRSNSGNSYNRSTYAIEPVHQEDVSLARDRGYNVPAGFVSYSAAARSSLVTPAKPKAAVPAFDIYTDFQPERSQQHQSPASPTTLEQYSHEIHSLSESCNRGSAQQAECILRSIIFKFKNGLHGIQPDGSCYNRFVTRRLTVSVDFILTCDSYCCPLPASFTPTQRLACRIRRRTSCVSCLRTTKMETKQRNPTFAALRVSAANLGL